MQDLEDLSREMKLQEKDLQERLSFKDNELDVLRDCFLQLKSFEEEAGEEGDDEDGEGDGVGRVNVEDKIKLMTDVSRVRSTLGTPLLTTFTSYCRFLEI